ncbi:alpha/beta hydrolase [Gaetbulibacter sp. M240]|uniref:alpha/beta fold hydrolase n=1 Tax=Gaetbulibacter sp. M240 TaxID=3126511 RepID=UPI00374F08E6
MEYKDFGGEGPPLIVIQGAHNYFDQSSSSPYWQHEKKSFIEFYTKLAEHNKVLAPLKRGFGRTSPQLEEDNVQTATEELILLMDKLEIEKAFFLGRDVPAQNMLYLAEHFPDRVLGLIFIQPVFVRTEIKDDATKDFVYHNYSQSYKASEYKEFKFKLSQQAYRPQIYKDSTLSINIPALLFYHAKYSEETLEMRRLERFISWVESTKKIEWNKEYSSPERAHFFEKLSKDKKRMYHIRDYLVDNNPIPKMNASLKRAFGNNLVVFNESLLQVNDVRTALLNVSYPVIKAFLFMTSEE